MRFYGAVKGLELEGTAKEFFIVPDVEKFYSRMYGHDPEALLQICTSWIFEGHAGLALYLDLSANWTEKERHLPTDLSNCQCVPAAAVWSFGAILHALYFPRTRCIRKRSPWFRLCIR